MSKPNVFVASVLIATYISMAQPSMNIRLTFSFPALLALALLVCSPLVVPVRGEAKAYHGEVVDAETGEPLVGAVVVLVWHKRPIIAMDAPEYFHDAREELTDAQGRFTLNASPAIDWNPFTTIKDPNVVIFQPGYEPFALLRTLTQHGFESFEDVDRALGKGATIKLPRLKTQEELRRYVSLSSIGFSGNGLFKEVPNFVRLLNIQKKMAGLTSFY